jgi:hypothetical protein
MIIQFRVFNFLPMLAESLKYFFVFQFRNFLKTFILIFLICTIFIFVLFLFGAIDENTLQKIITVHKDDKSLGNLMAGTVYVNFIILSFLFYINLNKILERKKSTTI